MMTVYRISILDLILGIAAMKNTLVSTQLSNILRNPPKQTNSVK